MNLKELAKKFDGREYRNEFTDDDIKLLKNLRLVVLHGYSDDLPYISGAMNEEFADFDVYFNELGIIESCDCDCVHYLRALNSANHVEWDFTNDGWDIRLWFDCDYETFKIYDDGDLYCTAVIVKLDDLLGV